LFSLAALFLYHFVMAWLPLTYAALRDRLSTDEFNRLLAECPTPEDKADEILESVAQDIASRVNAGRRKRGLPPVVNTGLNVPPGARRHAYIIARRELTDSYPSLAEFNGDDRKASVDEANSYLDDLANNNADGDDTGADSFVSVSGGSFRYSGADIMNFSESP
jgi:hypothetical protein